jgi:hypothetical protein
MYKNTLTAHQRDILRPYLIKRDGYVCFYCKRLFDEETIQEKGIETFDHLNCKQEDRKENLVFAHLKCNNEKKGNYDWQLLALDKLGENEALNDPDPESLSRSRRGRNKSADAGTEDEDLTESQMNLMINKTTRSFLDEKLPENSTNVISYSKTLKSITYLVIAQTKGRGSETAVRRSLDAFTSEFAPWEVYKEGKGNRVIRRRKSI